MEEKKMVKAILGIVIGLLVFGTGIFYLVKDKDDKESKKIYGTISAAGMLVAVISAIFLFIGK